MRLDRLAGVLLLAGLLAAGCSAPPPAAEEQPRRKSFEEANAWTPSRATAASDASADARAIEEKWQQARETNDPAERQRLANEALRDTRALADAPAGQ